MRARRRVPAVAGALGPAAAVAFAVSAALPASHPASGPGAQLAAWTVDRQADGSIRVTIRELRDPAGLQHTLRADGVPASVTFTGQRNPACQGYPGGGSQSERRHLLSSVATPAAGRNAMVIHPPALPSGAGLQIGALFQHDPGPRAVSRLAWAWCRPACSAPAASHPASGLPARPGREGPRGTPRGPSPRYWIVMQPG